MKSRAIWFFLIVVIVGVGIWAANRNRKPLSPLKTSFWYWQTPYELTPTDIASLKELNVKQMFVRGGTFSSDGENFVLRFPQSYGKGISQLPVHLVFNADGGVLRHFEDYDLEVIVPQISTRLLAQMDAAKKAGVEVIGVQFDFDIPTRLLPKYAELIHKVRESNPTFGKRKGFYFSLTGLMSWLGTSGIERLSNEVDFMVPQAYEGETGMSPDEMRPVFDPAYLQQQLPKAERLNCPYWIGIPAYGHAFLFNGKGQLTGTYRNLEAQDALRHPSFKLIDSYPSDRFGKRAATEKEWVGEQILKFKAIKPSPNGQGLGYTLAYSVPAPELVAKAKAVVEAHRGAGCQGVIIYRMPEPESSFTISLDSMRLMLEGKPVEPRFDVTVTRSKNPLEVIEGNLDKIPIDLYVEATNVGIGPTAVMPDALEITLKLSQPGVDQVRLRDFDSILYQRGSEGTSARPGNANILVLRKGFVAPGQKLIAGPIRLQSSGDLRVNIGVRIRTKSGLIATETQLPEVTLKGESGGSK